MNEKQKAIDFDGFLFFIKKTTGWKSTIAFLNEISVLTLENIVRV